MLWLELLVVSYLLYVDTVDLYEITIRYNLIVSHMKLVAPMPKIIIFWHWRCGRVVRQNCVPFVGPYRTYVLFRLSSSLPCGIRIRGILAGG